MFGANTTTRGGAFLSLIDINIFILYKMGKIILKYSSVPISLFVTS